MPSHDLPADIDPRSRNRLPPVDRAALDDAGRDAYDKAASDPRSLVGLQGPGGIRLHDPRLTVLSQPLNRHLRFDAGLDRRLAEVAILVTARAAESRFEWHAHEPVARELGVSDATIVAIRDGGAVDGLPEDEATMIRFVREAVAVHRVAPETFAAALSRFGRVPLLNYVSLIGNYYGTAILLTAFDQQLPPGASPAF